MSLQCDDGNTLDGDGCSSECLIEKHFTCNGGSSTNPSACSYSGPVSFEKKSFKKSPTENKVTLVFALSPKLPIFSTIDFNECVLPNFPTLSQTASYDEDTGEVTMVFDYGESLNTRDDLEVQFDPPNTL